MFDLIYQSFAEPLLTPEIPASDCWQPVCPPQVPWVRTLPAAVMMAACVLVPTVISVQPSSTQLPWLPTYPDAVARPTLPSAATMAVAVPPLTSSDFKWLSRYPDLIPRPVVLTALQTACVTGEIRPAAPPLQIWEPRYPDGLPSRPFLAALQQAVAYALGPTLPPVYPPSEPGDLEHGKLKHQLSAFDPDRRRPYLLPPLSFDPSPIPNPPPAEGYPDGYIIYPDYLPPLRRLPTEHQLPFVFYVIPLLPDPQLAWLPAFPDQHAVRAPLPGDQREVLTGPLNDVTVIQPVVWLPTFPDRFTARMAPTSVPAVQLAEDGALLQVPLLAWWVAAPLETAAPPPPIPGGAVVPLLPPAGPVGGDAEVILIANEAVEASTITGVLEASTSADEILTSSTIVDEEVD